MALHPGPSSRLCALTAAAALFLLAGPALAGGSLEVLFTQPRPHAVRAPTGTQVRLGFNRSLDPATLDGSLQVFGRWSGVVDGELSLADNDKVLVFQPYRPMFVGEWVTVMLSKQLRGAGGESLETSFHFEFMTATTPGTGDFVLADTLSTRLAGEGLIQSYGIYSGDINGDGAADFSIPNEVSNDVRVFLNDGCGNFDGPFLHPLPFGATPSANEGQDLDGDGDTDFVTADIGTGAMSVFVGDGDGDYAPSVSYFSGGSARGVAMLDAEGDGDVDVVLAHRTGDDMGLHLNNGDGTFAPVIRFEGGGLGETGVAAADADGDGIADLFIANHQSDDMSLMLGDGNGGFALSDTERVGNAPWQIAIGDLDGDGRVDAATADAFDASATVVRNAGAGGLAEWATLPTGVFPIAIDIGDLDGDGDLDIVTSEFSSSQWTCYTNDGNAAFGSPFTLPSPSAGSCATLVDYDRDGFLDIVGIDEVSDNILLWRQAVPLAAGVQPASCGATMRVDNRANSGGFGFQPAHLVRPSTAFHWGVSGEPEALYALMLGVPAEPGVPSAFGRFHLTSPWVIGIVADLDDRGEVTIPVPIFPTTSVGLAIGLQAFVNTSDGLRLTNAEAITIAP